MKTIILKFIGGYWDGATMRTDSPDYEEQLLAAGCFEMSHHGTIGGECAQLSSDAVEFARRHGRQAAEQATLCENHRYLVSEYRETETEIIITLKHHTMRDV